MQAEVDREAQKIRVLNMVRLLYYQALGAQQQVELRDELAKIAREAAGINMRWKEGENEYPDILKTSGRGPLWG